MNIFRLLFELFVIYIVYKLIFDFIIPIYQASKQVKQKMSDMHERMQQNERPPVNNSFTKPAPMEEHKRPAPEDYIDYEEIK